MVGLAECFGVRDSCASPSLFVAHLLRLELLAPPRACGSLFLVEVSGLGVTFRFRGVGCRVYGFGFGVLGFGLRV